MEFGLYLLGPYSTVKNN